MAAGRSDQTRALMEEFVGGGGENSCGGGGTGGGFREYWVLPALCLEQALCEGFPQVRPNKSLQARKDKKGLSTLQQDGKLHFPSSWETVGPAALIGYCRLKSSAGGHR